MTPFVGSSTVVIDDSTTFVSPAQAAAPVYWYYCTEPAGYFPYVQSCNKAWIPVVPQSVPAG
jgi:hypothetical protein